MPEGFCHRHAEPTNRPASRTALRRRGRSCGSVHQPCTRRDNRGGSTQPREGPGTLRPAALRGDLLPDGPFSAFLSSWSHFPTLLPGIIPQIYATCPNQDIDKTFRSSIDFGGVLLLLFGRNFWVVLKKTWRKETRMMGVVPNSTRLSAGPRGSGGSAIT